MNLAINNINELLKTKDKVGCYLREEWFAGNYPKLEKIINDLKIRNIRTKSLFFAVLAYFEEYKIILYIEERGVERIIPHPRLELTEPNTNLFVDPNE